MLSVYNIVYFVHNSKQQDVVSKKIPKVQNMVWPTIQLHDRQMHDYAVSITLVHSMTGHSVVTYHNTLTNNASIDVIIRFYIIIVPFSNELVNSDICSTTHLWWCFILPHYISNVLANS